MHYVQELNWFFRIRVKFFLLHLESILNSKDFSLSMTYGFLVAKVVWKFQPKAVTEVVILAFQSDYPSSV